jgi:O-antigen/teichoic acid export membrane protein
MAVTPGTDTWTIAPNALWAETPKLGRVLVRNTLANLIGQAVLLLLTFFSVPYTAHRLGTAQYGAMILLLTYIEAFGLLNLGINPTLVKYIAQLLPQHRMKDIQGYVGTSFALYAVTGLLIGLLASVLARWVVTRFLNVPLDLQHTVTLSFWIASAAFLFRFVGQVPAAIPIAAQRFDIANFLNVGSEATRIVGVLGVLYLGHFLVGVMMVTVVASFLFCGASFIAARRLIPDICLRPGFSRAHFLSLVRFSKFVVVGNLTNRVVTNADNVLIGYFLPVSSMAFYGVAYALGQKLWTLAGTVAGVVFPAASSLSRSSQESQLQSLYLRGTKAVTAAVCFPALALCIFSREFLLHWIGPEFAEQGALVLRLLAGGFFLNCLGHVPYLMLQSTGYPEVAARLAMIYGVANVALFALLIPRFGIVGAAAGFLASQILVVPWIVHRANRLFRIRWSALLANSYRPLLVASGLGCLACLGLRPWASSMLRLLVASIVGGLVYMVATWTTGLGTAERAECLAAIDQLRFSSYRPRREGARA